MFIVILLALSANPNYVAGATPPAGTTAKPTLPTSCFLTGCGCGCLDGKGCICRTPSHLRGVTYEQWKARLARPAVIVPAVSYRSAPAYNFMPANFAGAACRGGG